MLVSVSQVMEEIVQRTASAMVKKGVPFSGVLFAGLMIKDGRVRPLLKIRIMLKLFAVCPRACLQEHAVQLILHARCLRPPAG